jgi:hypothetical protein
VPILWDELPLFTENPRRHILGNPGSNVGDFRKLRCRFTRFSETKRP